MYLISLCVCVVSIVLEACHGKYIDKLKSTINAMRNICTFQIKFLLLQVKKFLTQNQMRAQKSEV